VLGTASRGQHEHRDKILGSPQFRRDRKAVFAGKHHIENDSVKIPDIFFAALSLCAQQLLKRAFAVGSDFDRVPLRLQVVAQPGSEVRFILDDQDAAHSALLGSSRTTVVPCPSPALSANTRPPCFLAIARTMNNPRPVPFTCATE